MQKIAKHILEKNVQKIASKILLHPSIRDPKFLGKILSKSLCRNVFKSCAKICGKTSSKNGAKDYNKNMKILVKT